MFPKAMEVSLTITKVALGETAGNPSSSMDATEAALKFRMIHFAESLRVFIGSAMF